MAQRKRAGLITRRTLDRNQSLLPSYALVATLFGYPEVVGDPGEAKGEVRRRKGQKHYFSWHTGPGLQCFWYERDHREQGCLSAKRRGIAMNGKGRRWISRGVWNSAKTVGWEVWDFAGVWGYLLLFVGYHLHVLLYNTS